MVFLFFLFPILTFAQSDFDRAEKLFREEKFEQSQVLLENVLATQPSNLKAIEYLGDIAGHNKSWDKAIGYYRILKQLNPLEANYYYKFGGALGMKATQVNKLKALGMISEIKESFEKAIVLNPKHIEARWALVMLYLQLPAIVGGSETRAIKYSNELLKLSPVDGYLSKGQIEEYFERYTSAEQQYKKAIAAGSTKKGTQMLANLYKSKMNQPEKVAKIKI